MAEQNFKVKHGLSVGDYQVIDTYGNVTVPGTLSITGITTVSGSIIPSSDITYDLGSPSYRFRDLYLSGATLHIGDTKLTRNSTTGDVEISDATTGELKTVKVKQVELDDSDPNYTVVMKRIDGVVKFVVKDRITGTESIASVDLSSSDVYDSSSVDAMLDDIIAEIENLSV